MDLGWRKLSHNCAGWCCS